MSDKLRNKTYEIPALEKSLLTSLDIVLVDNRLSKAQITIPEGAAEMEQYAAMELQYHIKLVSGADVPIIVTNIPNSSIPTVLIATPTSCPMIEDMFNEDITWLSDLCSENGIERFGDDGFAIRKVDNTIYIFGINPCGALNGVYDFIEKNLGVLWIRADEFGLLYDDMPTIIADRVNYREKSPFQVRGWHLCGTGDEGCSHSDDKTEIMLSRNKLNAKFAEFENKCRWDRQASIGLNPLHLGHNVKDWLTRSSIYQAAECKGEYWNTGTTHATSPQINYWNTSAADAVAESVLSFLNNNPNLSSIGIGIEDNAKCPNENLPFDYEYGRSVTEESSTVVYPDDPAYLSTVFFTFLNHIADKVAEKYPKVIINTFAYFFAEVPPKCAIRKNIRVVFAPIGENMTQSIPNNIEVYRNLESWKKVTNNLVIYNYYGCSFASSYYERPIADRIQADLQYYAQSGFNGTLPEGAINLDRWEINALTYWLYAKLTWNPNENIDKLINLFCKKAYGNAAEKMRTYYDLIKLGWDQNKQNTIIKWWTALAVYLKAFVENTGLQSDMQAALDAAWLAAGDGTPSQNRIQYIKEAFEQNLRNLAYEESAAAMRTKSGKAAVLATINQENPFTNEIWATAPVMEKFFQSGSTNIFPAAPTRVRMLWDNKYLYVGYENYGAYATGIQAATEYADAGYGWKDGTDDVKTFISPDPDPGNGMYCYFGNPNNLHFSCFKSYSDSPIPDLSSQNTENTAARIFIGNGVNHNRWIFIQAIPFHHIGITGPANSKTEVYAYFCRNYDNTTLGWNGAHTWHYAYMRPIKLMDITDDT